MNPYQTNWQYGYTLGPPSTTQNGAYTQYYGRVPGPAPPQPPTPAPATASTVAPYSSDYSSGNFPPATNKPNSYPKAGHIHRQGQGVNQNNLKQTIGSINFSRPPPPSGPSSWAQIKPPQTIKPEFKAKVFVTATDTSSNTSTMNASAPLVEDAKPSLIGPQKPQAVVNPSMTVEHDIQACMKLHELATYNKLIEHYEKVEAESTSGNFVVLLTLGSEAYKGIGSNLKTAKQNAASQALAQSSFARPPEKRTMKARTPGMTATSELHELATKKGVHLDFKFLEPFNFEFKHSMRMWGKKEMLGNYRVQLTVSGYEFYGQAELPQQAKHNAAIQAIPVVRNLPDPSKAATGANVVVGDVVENSESLPQELKNKNVIMALNEIAMNQALIPEWTMVGEHGPPHMKTFSWKLKMGEHECIGSGASKKIAKTTAAQHMMNLIPEEWKHAKVKKRKPPSNKRKHPGAAKAEPPAKKATPGEDGTPVYQVIQTTNPISALYEYCKKSKLPDPDFECVSENVLETWQRENKTFKKTEYTMKLDVCGKSFFAAANTKKAAKTAVATEAWNKVRAGIV